MTRRSATRRPPSAAAHGALRAACDRSIAPGVWSRSPTAGPRTAIWRSCQGGRAPVAVVENLGLGVAPMLVVVATPVTQIDAAHERDVTRRIARTPDQHELLMMRSRAARTRWSSAISAAGGVDGTGQLRGAPCGSRRTSDGIARRGRAPRPRAAQEVAEHVGEGLPSTRRSSGSPRQSVNDTVSARLRLAQARYRASRGTGHRGPTPRPRWSSMHVRRAVDRRSWLRGSRSAGVRNHSFGAFPDARQRRRSLPRRAGEVSEHARRKREVTRESAGREVLWTPARTSGATHGST